MKTLYSVIRTPERQSPLGVHSLIKENVSTDHLMPPPDISSPPQPTYLSLRLSNIPSRVKLLYQLFIHTLLLATVTLLVVQHFHSCTSSSPSPSSSSPLAQSRVNCHFSFEQLTRRQKNMLVDEFLQGKINGTNYTSCNICDLTRQLRNFTLECASMRFKLNQSLAQCNEENDELRDLVKSQYSLTYASLEHPSFSPSSSSSSYSSSSSSSLSSSGHRVNRDSLASNDHPLIRREQAEMKAISQVDFENKLQKELVRDYEKNFHRNFEHRIKEPANASTIDMDVDE